MEHFANLIHFGHATPIPANNWVTQGPKKIDVSYKKTRSTLAMNAADLAGLKDEQATETFEYLMGLCKTLSRDEIVIECLQNCPQPCEDRSVRDFFDTVRRDVNRASRKMDLCPPRVALEKRGQHYDLRIYPTFH